MKSSRNFFLYLKVLETLIGKGVFYGENNTAMITYLENMEVLKESKSELN